jgi:hypothetical protein
MEHITQRRVSAADTRITKPPGVPNGVFDAGRQAKAQARPAKAPPLDLKAIVIDTSVPVPPKNTKRSRTYEALLRTLNVGDSVVLLQPHALSLARAAHRIGAKTTRRSEGEGKARVWLTQAAPQAPAAVRVRKP